MFALLPVRYVIVYAQNGEKLVLEAKFDKNVLQAINLENTEATEIIERMKI